MIVTYVLASEFGNHQNRDAYDWHFIENPTEWVIWNGMKVGPRRTLCNQVIWPKSRWSADSPLGTKFPYLGSVCMDCLYYFLVSL